MTGHEGHEVPAHLVQAAIRAAAHEQVDVADVPVVSIAREAGLSRSTLLRRLGGSRRALDEAVRAAGVDPGGRTPVRERAIDSGAKLISEHGLGSVTLEAVAAAAGCSVHSLYASFGGRDQLLYAIFERFTPFVRPDLLDPEADLEQNVRRLYRVIAEALGAEPRVLPALLAEVLTRPGAEGGEMLATYLAPRMFAGPGKWLAEEVAAGRIRDLPTQLLIQQMLTPIMLHFVTRDAAAHIPGIEVPDPDQACDTFAEAFLRAVALPDPARQRGTER